MAREAIKQATCENCDEDDYGDAEEQEFSVQEKTFLDDDNSTIKYEVRCTCGATGVISVDTEGTHSGEGINHDDASWNQDDEDEEE